MEKPPQQRPATGTAERRCPGVRLRLIAKLHIYGSRVAVGWVYAEYATRYPIAIPNPNVPFSRVERTSGSVCILKFVRILRLMASLRRTLPNTSPHSLLDSHKYCRVGFLKKNDDPVFVPARSRATIFRFSWWRRRRQ